MRQDSKNSLSSGLRRSSSSRISTANTLASTMKIVVQSQWFGNSVLVMIMVNAAWIGVDVDWNNTDGQSSYPSPVPNEVFLAAENIFCCFFVLEIVARFLSYEPKSQFFTHPRQWKSNLFDFYLVAVMVLEVWILAPIGAEAHLNHLTLVRLLRLMRLLRISRIFRMVPELGMMVRTLMQAIRTVSSTLVMEIGIMYVFAVIFTQWAKGHSNPCLLSDGDQCVLSEYFGSIPKSLVTFMQILIFDDTFAIIRPILADSWYMGCLLLFFIIFGAWTVLNMLVGIMCEIQTTSTVEEKRRMLEQRVREVFAMMDSDGSGTVTREEFEQQSVQQQLVKLGVSKATWQNAFDILDEDGSGDFDVEEFLAMVFKLLHPPKSQDIQELNTRLCQIQAAMNIKSSNPSLRGNRKNSSKNSGKMLKSAGQASLFATRASNGDCGKLSRSMSTPIKLRTPKEDLDTNFFSSESSEPAPIKQTLPASPHGLQNAQHDGPTAKQAPGHTHPRAPKRPHDGPPAEQAAGHSHPFAPKCPPPRLLPSKSAWEVQSGTLLSQTPASHLPNSQQKTRTDTEWSLKTVDAEECAESQAQEVYEKLRQLGQSTEKAEEALRLVHGTPLWQNSDEKVDRVVQDKGLCNVPENDFPHHDLPANNKLEDSAVVDEMLPADPQEWIEWESAQGTERGNPHGDDVPFKFHRNDLR